jgi:hypothetical protein
LRLLYLTTVLPNNKKTGGEIASYQCIAALRSKFYVDVIGYERKGESIKLQEGDVVVDQRIIESKSTKLFSLIWFIGSVLSNRTFSSQKYYSRKYIHTVLSQLKISHYDAVIIEHSQLSFILDIIPKDLPIIFNSQNVEYLIYAELAGQSNNYLKKIIYLRESKLMKSEELRMLSKSHSVWVLTDADKNDYQMLNSKALINRIDVPGGFSTLVVKKEQFDIGMLGTWTWESNRKGLLWFLEKVLPEVDIKYTVAVGGKGSLLLKDQYPRLNVLGFVDDAQDFLFQPIEQLLQHR